MMKCDNGHKFVICGIVLHQWNFIAAHFSMLENLFARSTALESSSV